jgi:hypothetical protein
MFDIILNKQYYFFAGYSSSFAMDITMGFPTPEGLARRCDYWVQPAVNGCT